ncbi:MAG TPA: glycosyltransferase [Casimicrobiaceae bacterium]|nr:glycosyltransferase [Casimicrobiaceae bacterium]
MSSTVLSGREIRGGEAPAPVHVINPLWDPQGGSDWRAVEMYAALSHETPTRLWSRFDPAPIFRERYPVETIRPWRGRWPVGGTFIFVGAYFRVGHWFKAAFPQRTILVYNTYQPDRLAKALARLEAWHRTPVEVVYTSPLLRRLSSRPGPVIESPIDLDRFIPCREPRQAQPFTVGRLSRDIPTKHHHDDAQVYRALAVSGIAVRVMGGTCVRDRVDTSSRASFVPAGSQRPVDFLHSLDCFYYRTSDHWLEAFGRVVFEAMACGLPVVCGRRGGYADYIAHGVNGFLFDTSEQAIALIRQLRTDPGLRARIGRAARQTVEELYGGSAWRRKLAFFLARDRRREPSFGTAFDPTPSRML